MGKIHYMRSVLTTFLLAGFLIIQVGLKNAEAADSAAQKATDLERINPGTEAPEFNLESVEKNRVKLSSYENRKNVILIFYRGYW